MKRQKAMVLVLACMLTMVGCGREDTCKLRITVPAGSEEAFFFSDEEICPTGEKITVSCGEGMTNTRVLLELVGETLTAGYVATELTPDHPVQFDTEKGVWLKVGVSVQNGTNADKNVYVEVSGVTVRSE